MYLGFEFYLRCIVEKGNEADSLLSDFFRRCVKAFRMTDMNSLYVTPNSCFFLQSVCDATVDASEHGMLVELSL